MVVIEEVELLVEFIEQRNRTPHNMWRSDGGPSVSRLLKQYMYM